jgi:hypothetical protein
VTYVTVTTIMAPISMVMLGVLEILKSQQSSARSVEIFKLNRGDLKN